MISDSALTNLRLVFKPQSNALSQNLDRYFSQHKTDRTTSSRTTTTTIQLGSQLVLYSQKFVLLLDDMSRIELRYLDGQNNNDVGKITRVIGSRDVEQDKWNELIVTDASSDSQINNHMEGLTRIVLVTPDKIDLSFKLKPEVATTNSNLASNLTELFVAGMPDALRKLSREASDLEQAASGMLGEKLTQGFRGCIRELSINSRDYDFRSDFNGDTLDGFDIGE